MNDDQYFLANAYFDGELTDDELHIAEADPDVMSEVDRLRTLQSLLRDSDLPSASARIAAIAAAMAEFAPGTAGTVNPGSPGTRGHVTAIRRQRPAYGRYLAVAAAVAAIGGVGVVVAGVLGSDSDDDSSGTDEAFSTETLARVDDDIARSASATTLATAMEMEASDQMLTAPAPAASTATELAEGESSAATTAASDIAAGAIEMSDTTEMTTVDPLAHSTAYPPTGGPIEPIADRDQTITTPGELAGLGVLLTSLRDAGTLGATPETRCTFDDASIEIVDSTRYRFSDLTSTVLVALIAGDIEGHTLAIDPDTCDILVVGP